MVVAVNKFSVTRLAIFESSLVTRFLTKVALMCCNYFGHFEKQQLLNKNCWGYFLATSTPTIRV